MLSFTTEQKAEIANRAAENWIAATIHHFAKKYPGGSTGARVLPVSSHTIVPPRRGEQTAFIFLGTWPTMVPASFFTATA